MVCAVPAFAVGVGLTVIFIVDVTAEQGAMPVVVRVSTAVPEKTDGGVQVAFKVLALGVNVPPAGVVHVPPVAAPPTDPDKIAVLPWQIVCAVPALSVGVGRTIILTFDMAAEHGAIPVVVSVRIAVPE
jgi:hypothetical protein